MGSALRRRLWLVAPILVGAFGGTARADERDAFARDVDLSRFRLLAVQHDGRLKTIDSLAREHLRAITGSVSFEEQDPVYTYLDLMFRPSAYTQRALFRVKSGPVLGALLQAAGDAIAPEEAARIRADKRVSPSFLSLRSVAAALDAFERDVRTTGREVFKLRAASEQADPRVLAALLAVVPPVGGTAHSMWRPAGRSGDSVAGASWRQLESAWRAGDAATTNAALDALADRLPDIQPRLYPPFRKLAVEHWYYKYDKLTWTWVVYALAIPPLLLAALRRGTLARRIGFGLFLVGFALHSTSVGVRWYLAGRIPNTNMFEAVIAAAWFGAAAAWVLEVWLDRRAMRNLFALGASVCGMLAMMACHFMPVQLHGDIANPMPILRTVWLKIHVNLILLSYVLIGLGFVTALVYLVLRAMSAVTRAAWYWRRWAGHEFATVASNTGGRPWLSLYDRRGEFRTTSPREARQPEAAVGPAPPTKTRIVVIALAVAGSIALAVLLRGHVATWIGKTVHAGSTGYTIVGGLYVLLLLGVVALGPLLGIGLLARTARILLGRDTRDDLVRAAPLSGVLDGATMVLIELAFVTLWVGIALGAAWADVSWGRPWGWDPKEVFALNTWIIFLILLHVRFRVQDKGLWTAVLAVVGFVVMLFNWIGVNFFIVGLHSYA
jgi:ABC-type transport system involved in cytochrome c biogenesis permease subunit